MSNQYIATTPKNPAFNGKTCGVRFERGRAFVSEHTIDPFLKWSVDEVARKMKEDFGYEVTLVEQEGLAPVVETVYATVPETKPAPDIVPVVETPKEARKARGGK